jgi:polysaccharide pyruvyl transferase WcaK-like protein
MGSQEADLLHRIELADRVVVNGEGTLHHNQRTALAALAVARTAQVLGKEVHVVNTSVQAMHSEVLTMVVGNATRLVVREPQSYRYLRGLNLDCQLGSDCAFAATYEPARNVYPLPAEVAPQRACLVTGGCGARDVSIIEITKTLRRAGYSPFYYRIGDGDPLSVEQCASAGIPVVTWNAIPWNVLPDYLKQVKLVVSGRYHIIIFALMARIPFIPLSSNTWKIEGLCELFHWPIPVLPGAHGFVDALSSLSGVQSDMSAAFECAESTGFELATKNVVGSFG